MECGHSLNSKMGYKVRKRRTVFFTIVTFALALFMVLNLMMVQISPEGLQHDFLINNKEDKIFYKKQIQQSKKSIQFDEFHDSYVIHGQRKPKTTNLEKDSDRDTFEKNTYKDSVLDQDRFVFTEKPNHRQKVKHDNIAGKKDNNMKYEHLNIKHYENYPSVMKQDFEERNDNIQKVEDMEVIDEDDDDEEDDDDYDDNDDEYNDEYEYDDKVTYKPNRPFQPGDFDDIDGYEKFKKPKLLFEEVPKTLKHLRDSLREKKLLQTDTEKNRKEENQSSIRKTFLNLVQDGIYWSPYVESLIPKGMSYRNVTKLVRSLRGQLVRTLEQPTWDKCGRPKNGFLVLEDNTPLCARYRQPHTAFVFGEVLSFYLSRLLGMDNVPTVILSKTNSTSKQWRAVNIDKLGWEENKTIAFIHWIDHLNSGLRSKSYIPHLILQAYKTGQPIQKEDILEHYQQTSDLSSLVDLVQWGTMIIFDYLTGNYDRVASMQDAAEKEYNPHIIEEAIRNLPKSAKNGKLWLIDNESGLLDAYHLLESPKRSSTRFTMFHKQMLHTTCIFQSSVVKALQTLNEHSSPHTRLMNFATSHEPLMKEIPKDKYYKLFVSLFHKRLNDVEEWIRQCRFSLNK